GEALIKRLNRLLPNNRFEFVMTSSDYFICKPNHILFDIALQKSGLSAEYVWYCGDNPQNDVEGAAQVGIFSVWYDNSIDKDYIDRANERQPKCDHLYIKEWDEMIKVIEGLKK
ncbi:MAG: HAD-IA family hydrolase, partial [Clostridia bacterium]|nr:HAD-IA family hydrolase [Clostridia bacterium]